MTMIALILLVVCVIMYRELSNAKEELAAANSMRLQEQQISRNETESAKQDAMQAHSDAEEARKDLEDYKYTLKRNMRKLHDSILDKFLHTNEAHGTIIDQEFDNWWKLWDGYEVGKDPDDSDNADDDEDNTLETVGELMRRLSRLPNDCDDYIVRFKEKDGDNWIQPEKCWIDDNGDIILGLYNDEESHDALTIADLYNTLDDLDTLADNNFSGWAGRPSVNEDSKIYILDYDDASDADNYNEDSDSTYYQAIDEKFIILPRKQRVEIPMS